MLMGWGLFLVFFGGGGLPVMNECFMQGEM